MKRLSLLLLILLLPVFAAAGFYGYLWWRVNDLAEQMVVQASPFMEIKYGGVRIDLVATEVALQDLRVAPLGIGDQLKVEEVVLKSSDWSQMMRLDGSLQKDAWPDSLSLRLEGMLFHLDGPMMQQWTAMALQAQPQEGYTFGRFCSSLQGPELMQAMGYRMINLDMAMGYHFDAATRRMTVDVETDAQQLSDFSFQMTLEGASNELTAATMSTGTALQSVVLHARDKGFNHRYREYCASQAGVKGDQFDEALRQEFIQLGQMIGLQPPEGILQSVVDMYKPGANMGLNLRPSRPIGQFDLVSVESPDAFIELLNPTLDINGKRIGAPEISELLNEAMAAASAPVETHSHVGTPQEGLESELPSLAVPGEQAKKSTPAAPPAQDFMTQSPPAPTVPEVKGFRSTPLSDVGEHVGQRVRMVTYFGRRIEGRILEVGQSEVMIEQRMQRGVATYSIALDKVAELEVYR